MKREIKTTILFTLLFITTIYSQNDFFEFTNNIKWFSTQSELLEDYSQKIRKTKHYYSDYDKTITDYMMDSIQLGKYNCAVSFSVDSITRKLSKLNFLIPQEVTEKVDSQVLSKYMDSIFTSKYGKPHTKKDDLGDYLDSFDRKWYTENFIVDVTHMVFDKSQVYSLVLKGLDNKGSDFRIANWGDSKESIISKEGKINKASIDGIYLFDDFVAGMSCSVAYIFTNNKLTMAKYIFKEEHSNKNDFINDYDNIVSLLSDKYGEASYNSSNWRNDLYKGDIEHYGLAISLGHLNYSAGWLKNDKTDISVLLSGENYDIELVIQYLSKKYQNLRKQEYRKKSIDKL